MASHARPRGLLWGRAGAGMAEARAGPQRCPGGREQLGSELRLAVVARSCLDCRACRHCGGCCADTAASIPRLSFSPQVRPRQPQAAPQHSWTTISPLHGDRLNLLPGPGSSQGTWSLSTQVGSWRETGPKAFPTPGGADGKAGGPGGDRWDRPPSKLRPPCRAWQAARPCRGCSLGLVRATWAPGLSSAGSGSTAAATRRTEHCLQSWQDSLGAGGFPLACGGKGPQSHGLSPHLLLQTDGLEGREALPRSRVTRPERVPMPNLPSVPRLEATQAAAPWHARAAPAAAPASVTKLPALPAAASGSSRRGRAHAVGLAASSPRELVPPARGILGDWSMAVRAERWGPAPHSPTSPDVALESSVQAFLSGVPGHAVAASWEPGQQVVVQGHLAHTTALASPARTAQAQAAWGCKAPAAQPGPRPHAPGGTRAAGEPRAPGSSAKCTGKGHWARPVARQAHHLPPLRLVHGKPLRPRPVEAPKHLVVMRLKMEHAEQMEEEDKDKTSEDLSGQSQLQEDISIHTIWRSPSLLRLSQEPHAGPQKVPGSNGSMARDAIGGADDHPQHASPAPSADSDVEPAAFCLAGGPGDQGHSEPLPASSPEDVLSWAPALPAAMLQAADDRAKAVGTAQGILGDRHLAAGAEGQGPAPIGPVTRETALEDLEEEWEDVPDRDAAGEGDGDTQSVSLAPSEDADTEAAASALARGRGHKGHRAPIPAQRLAYSFPSSIGIAALPRTPARRRRPSVLRTACRALRRAFCCSFCTAQ